MNLNFGYKRIGDVGCFQKLLNLDQISKKKKSKFFDVVIIIIEVTSIQDAHVDGLVPAEKLIEFNSIREAALSDFAHMHQATVAELFDHEIVYDHVDLVRIRFYAASEVSFALVDLLD